MRGIICEASRDLAFDDVIAAIAQRYPGTRIVEEDWYAQKHAEHIAFYSRLNRPTRNVVLDSLERVWAEIGLQRGFEIPISERLVLYARLDKTGGYFLCRESSFDGVNIEPLVDILRKHDLALRFFSGRDEQE